MSAKPWRFILTTESDPVSSKTTTSRPEVSASSETKVAPIFSSGMVLQRHKPIRVWGQAHPGTDITVSLGALTSSSARSTAAGDWSVSLDAQDAATDQILTISDGRNVTTFVDVSIGEVWVAGGQSNMEFHLEFDADRDRVIAGEMPPAIRFFDVPEVSYEGQEDERDYSRFGVWRRCTPEDLPYFSAVGYYFAEQISVTLGVPVGIVGCNWGGTPAAAWADPTKLGAGPGRVWIDEYEAQLPLDLEEEAAAFRMHKMSDPTNPFGDPVLYRLLKEGFPEEEEEKLMSALAKNFLFTMGLLHPNRPGGLYGTMVRRYAAPFTVRGVIWYQGESDEAHSDIYASVLTAVVESWREAWADAELPFLIVQLAPFGGNRFGTGDRFPELREQQAKVAATVPSTWLVSSSDAGSLRDIHPKNKRPIGVRLAGAALAYVYGRTPVKDSPTLRRARRDNGKVILEFAHGEGLHSDTAPLPLVIQDPRGRDIQPDSIAIEDSKVIIDGDIPNGSLVSFAWTGYYRVELRNDQGLPAFPFKVIV